jgi:hypothetical protein
MKSLRQAFNSAWQAVGSTAACENCPLHKLHRLCQELEGIVINQIKTHRDSNMTHSYCGVLQTYKT